MRILGNLTFAGLGQIQNLRVENLAVDPVTPLVGQVWYNSTEGMYKGFDGTTVISFASGGNTDTILAEVDAIETAVGLNSDGTYTKTVGSNYIDGAANVKQAAVLLDAQVKTNSDSITGLQTSSTNLSTEVDAIETAVGLNADGTYSAPTTSNYINGSTSLRSADALLDGQMKTNTDAIAANGVAITTKVSKAGDAMTGNLAFQGVNKVIGLAAPTDAGDAVNKAYVDAMASGLSWLHPVQGIGAALPADTTALIAGDRFADTTDNKIYTYNGAAFDAGVALNDADAFFDKTSETGYVFSGSAIVQFTGLGQVTAGVGLSKTGNVMDINLGAGIGQLPTDEVGIDTLPAGGLFLTVDGSTDSTDTAAQLSVRLDGASLTRSVAGVKIAAAGVTEVELNASVAGAGLTGGAGAALAVGGGTGIVVSADTVAFDETYGDARYINTAGDSMAGDLTLFADPTTNLMAATKQYVDKVGQALANSTFVYDGAVAQATHVVAHNIGSQYCNVTVVDSANKQILPDSVTFDDANQLTVGFSSAITCKVIVTGKYVAA